LANHVKDEAISNNLLQISARKHLATSTGKPWWWRNRLLFGASYLALEHALIQPPFVLTGRKGVSPVSIFRGNAPTPVTHCCEAIYNRLPSVLLGRRKPDEEIVDADDTRCFRLSAEGLSTGQIASSLVIERTTLRDYLEHAAKSGLS